MRKTIRSNIKLLSMEDNFTEVDAVIVTIIKDFDLIYEKLIKIELSYFTNRRCY